MYVYAALTAFCPSDEPKGGNRYTLFPLLSFPPSAREFSSSGRRKKGRNAMSKLERKTGLTTVFSSSLGMQERCRERDFRNTKIGETSGPEAGQTHVYVEERED